MWYLFLLFFSLVLLFFNLEGLKIYESRSVREVKSFFLFYNKNHGFSPPLVFYKVVREIEKLKGGENDDGIYK